jgi:hypothetical protein
MALLFFLFPQPELASVAPFDAVRINLLTLKRRVAIYNTLIPAQLPEIVKCRTCGQFCTNNRVLKRHRSATRLQRADTPLAGQLPSTALPTLEPVPPDLLEEVDSLSAEELIDLFQRPLYDIERA